MKIGLLGGTFDPPHMGHLIIAEYILKNTTYPIDEIWFTPTYQQKYYGEEQTKNASAFSIRLEMTQCMVQRIPHVRVSTIEQEHMLSGQTKDLFQWLPGGNEYCSIIGTDQLASFHRWGEYEKLLQTMPFLVYPRADYPPKPLYEGMVLLDGDAPITNFSSTMVREMVARGERADGIILPEVYEIIQRHGLYRNSGRREHII